MAFYSRVNVVILPVPASLVEDLLMKKGIATLKMYGSSMSPLLAAGRNVLISEVAAERIGIGDIICFRQEELLIAHRVVRVHRAATGPVYLTKGDNRAEWDGYLRPDEVIGKVIAIEGRPITGPASTLTHKLIAILSFAEAKLPEWRRSGPSYKLLARWKHRAGLKSSLYPVLERFVKSALATAEKILMRL